MAAPDVPTVPATSEPSFLPTDPSFLSTEPMSVSLASSPTGVPGMAETPSLAAARSGPSADTAAPAGADEAALRPADWSEAAAE
eukprot:1436693-Pyramimonas_sp.AAC.2